MVLILETSDEGSVIVVLAGNSDATFRRGVRDKDGNLVEMLTFERGEPVEVPAELYPAIKRDIGNALLVCTESNGGLLRGDHEATAEFKEFLETGRLPKKTPAKGKGKGNGEGQGDR